MLSIGKRLFSTSSTRLNTLVFVESSKSKVSPASLSSITAALQLGKPVSALVAGPEGEIIANDVSKINGITKVIVAKGDQYNHYLPEELSPLVKDILTNNNFTHFVTAASAVGKSLLPRVGALLDVQPISDIVKVESEHTFVRPIYAGNALSTVKSNDKLILTSVRSSAFAPIEISDATNPIEEFSGNISSNNRTEFVSESILSSERPELGSASKVVAGGRGLKNKETFDQLLEPLAIKLNAAVGASRAAVDNGFCDNSLQIGQTGKIIAPDLYIAVGISGAIQHLAGMKDSKTIVAINKDPESPIFNVADIGLVGDVNEIIPELTEKL
ncbi:electron transfer flavoprotein alpha-subunit [Scheffersomyces coipomensis]|uniref:electron transfer flavoprotein alpha-subunit n=1 Tax=Scheffersomyces coipomensis TaxID=1788519 RepID=UPI00315D2D6F